ncbi:MAG: cation:proton antiporter [Hyphomicrobiaceae bacterium]
MSLLEVFLTFLLGYSLLSKKLEGTVLTGPMLFTVAGFLTELVAPAEFFVSVKPALLLHLAEIALVLLLFCDAARTDLSMLWTIRTLPARLLGIGLPLTLVLGTVSGWLLFPPMSLWEAAILAAILAPTDAGLGQAILTDPRVPLAVRQPLNVEAGLNDGLAVPFLLCFIALAASAGEGGQVRLGSIVFEQLGYGTLLGMAVGLAGGVVLATASSRGAMTDAFGQVAVITLPLLCLLVSATLGASAFIAAFVAGLSVQARYRDVGRHSLEFGEMWGRYSILRSSFFSGSSRRARLRPLIGQRWATPASA